jgi:hypothetical protein
LRIVQIGIGDGRLTESLLEMVQRNSNASRARYAGIDPFEGRVQPAPGLTLKDAHRRFRNDGLDVRLLPGEPAGVLARCANELRGTDLVIVSRDQQEGMAQAWHLVVRFLHKDSQVWVEEDHNDSPARFRILDPAQVRALVPTRRGRAA